MFRSKRGNQIKVNKRLNIEYYYKNSFPENYPIKNNNKNKIYKGNNILNIIIIILFIINFYLIRQTKSEENIYQESNSKSSYIIIKIYSKGRNNVYYSGPFTYCSKNGFPKPDRIYINGVNLYFLHIIL